MTTALRLLLIAGVLVGLVIVGFVLYVALMVDRMDRRLRKALPTESPWKERRS